MDCDTTQTKGQWGDFVKTVMKKQITWKAINALNSWETIPLSSGTPGVRKEHVWAHSVSLLRKQTFYCKNAPYLDRNISFIKKSFPQMRCSDFSPVDQIWTCCTRPTRNTSKEEMHEVLKMSDVATCCISQTNFKEFSLYIKSLCGTER